MSALAYRLLARTDPRPQLSTRAGCFNTICCEPRGRMPGSCAREAVGWMRHDRALDTRARRNLGGGPRARKRSADAADDAG